MIVCSVLSAYVKRFGGKFWARERGRRKGRGGEGAGQGRGEGL